MTVRRLRLLGDPVLNQVAKEVTEFGIGIRSLVNDMFDTMDDAGGVGLAANQIGHSLRVFVFDCQGMRGHIVNPTWRALDGQRQLSVEGCLSIPGVRANVDRFRSVVCNGVDIEGRPVAILGTGLLARCIQHETDHLDGTVFLERLSAEEKKLALSQVRTSMWWKEQ
ncbi:peptide deformylase [Corynebacterium sp. NML130628]|uniref:peptide deformylase n=1 Tax=Corynebacterium sp. NML130628 TaxID=1906333 RepID=UPI0008FB7CA7|nr:peptide deformylase [Corynebacterium sp. NML130628]OIR45583.1 peptide deformylase [Corynebacterium sp. NML130628]